MNYIHNNGEFVTIVTSLVATSRIPQVSFGSVLYTTKTRLMFIFKNRKEKLRSFIVWSVKLRFNIRLTDVSDIAVCI